MIESTTKAIKSPDMVLKDKQFKILPLYTNFTTNNSQVKRNKSISKLCLTTTEGSVIIPFTDILRLESDSNYTSVYTLDSKKYVISKTMKMLINLLPKSLFVRCHRSHFVNLDQIVAFNKSSLVLRPNIEIPIARQKYQEIVRSIKSNCVTF